jgi:TonB family protein
MKQIVIASAWFVFFSLATLAQSTTAAPATPYDRLVSAAQHSLLDDPELKPWHLKVDVTLIDQDGRNPVVGTVETWHSGKNNKTTYNFGESSRTVLRNGGDAYESSSGPDTPALADALLEAAVNPGPSSSDIDGTKPDLRKEHFGKVTLDCIMLSRPIRDVARAHMGLFPTYCLDEGGEKLRASYNFGSQTVLRNSLGTFQGREIATQIILDRAITKVAEAKVSSLTGFVPSEDFFKPDPSLTPIRSTTALISGGVIAGAILNKIPPVYPLSAKQNHVGGTVILRAIIGRDGHIYSLRPMSAPDPDLAVSAIAAVRQWTYKPYLLNGFPTEVDTTITVNYNLNSF